MTEYTARDLAEGWEFKILRSTTGAFRDRARLAQFLAEEAAAGWVLVEKFDDGRIRLKRPAAARSSDGALSFDPYRTRVGVSELGLGLLIAGGILSLIALVVGIGRLAFR